MIMAGTITKIDGERVWALVRPEGGTCADCSCEKPTRTIAGLLSGEEAVAPGDQCVIETSPFWSGLSAISLVVLSIGGAIGGWILGPTDETLQAISTLGGLLGGMLVTAVAFAPLRKLQQPRIKPIHVSLHQA